MKISQKKTCDRCKALREQSGYPSFKCDFEYEINRIGVPQEPCPKPLTNDRWSECYNEIKSMREEKGAKVDSYGTEITRGYLGLSFIGFSGSGATQHLQLARISFNPAIGYTLKNKIKCPGHEYKRGTPLKDVVKYAKYSKVLNESEAKTFPHNKIMIVFSEKFPFADLV